MSAFSPKECIPSRSNPAGSCPNNHPGMMAQVYDFNRYNGFSQHDLSEARTLIENGVDYKRAKLPIKVALYAHYQIAIDRLSPSVKSWIEKNSGSAGLIDTRYFTGLLNKHYLMAAGAVPETERLNQNIKPLDSAELDKLRETLCAKSEHEKIRILSQQIAMSYKILLLNFEAALAQGIERLMSKDGKVDLYERCRSILREEVVNGLMSYGRMRHSQAKDIAKANPARLPLTVIIGDAALVGAEIALHLPQGNKHRSVIGALTQVHQAHSAALIDAYLIKSKASDNLQVCAADILAEAIDDLKQPACPYHQHIDAKLAEGRVNSSFGPFVAGCPVFGTSSFPMIIQWADKVRKLLISETKGEINGVQEHATP